MPRTVLLVHRWWNGREPIRLKLHRDWTVRPINDARPFWGVPGQIAGHWAMEPGVPAHGATPARSTVVTMNGHQSYTVRRHPRHWGVVLESCWCLWTGFEMAPKGQDLDMEDAALSVSADDARQRREIEAYNNMAVRRG